MKTHHLPVKKTTQGKVDLKTTTAFCVYHVDVGGVCQTTRSLKTRCKKHTRHLFLGQPENLAVAELIMGTGQHEIQQHLQNGSGRKVCGLLG